MESLNSTLDKSRMRGAVLLTVLLALTGCDNNRTGTDAGNPGQDATTPMPDSGPGPVDSGTDAGTPMDGSTPDGGTMDGAIADGAVADGSTADGSTADGAVADASTMTDAGPVGGGAATSAQIQAVRAAADGTVDPALPIDTAVVTYVKPALGDDTAGFFVQAELLGPALFVSVDPTTLSPAAEVGQVVSFTVSEVGSVGGLREATMIGDWSVDSSGHDVSFLSQDVGTPADLVSALDTYESEIFSGSFTIAADFAGAGTAHVAAVVETATIMSESNLRFRIPATLESSLHLVVGCHVTVTNIPMWRFNPVAQLSSYDAADITVDSCPAPVVTGASGDNEVTATVAFSEDIDPATVMGDGSQFTIEFTSPTDGSTVMLGVTAASVVGHNVALTTAMQTTGTEYTVTVAATVMDYLGQGVDSTMNTATFTGYHPHLVINEVDANQPSTDTTEFVRDLQRRREPDQPEQSGPHLRERKLVFRVRASDAVHGDDLGRGRLRGRSWRVFGGPSPLHPADSVPSFLPECRRWMGATTSTTALPVFSSSTRRPAPSRTARSTAVIRSRSLLRRRAVVQT